MTQSFPAHGIMAPAAASLSLPVPGALTTIDGSMWFDI
jgi:hypothetical protein